MRETSCITQRLSSVAAFVENPQQLNRSIINAVIDHKRSCARGAITVLQVIARATNMRAIAKEIGDANDVGIDGIRDSL